MMTLDTVNNIWLLFDFAGNVVGYEYDAHGAQDASENWLIFVKGYKVL